MRGLLLLGVLLMGWGVLSWAQVSDDPAYWKEKAREYRKEPLKLRDKVQGYEQAIAELQERLEAYTRDNSQLIKNNRELQNVNASLEAELMVLRHMIDTMDSTPTLPQPQFYVQLGAYQYFDINHYFENAQCMQVQVDDRLNKYVVGSFFDLDRATRFRDDIRKLGIEDAWVVSVVDGERVTMREALDQLQANGQLTAEEAAAWLALFPEE